MPEASGVMRVVGSQLNKSAGQAMVIAPLGAATAPPQESPAARPNNPSGACSNKSRRVGTLLSCENLVPKSGDEVSAFRKSGGIYISSLSFTYRKRPV